MIPRFRASKVFSKMRERHRGTRGNSFIRFDILTRMQTHRDRSMYLHSVCVLTIRRKGENDRAEWRNGFIRVFARLLAPWAFFYPRIYRFFSFSNPHPFFLTLTIFSFSFYYYYFRFFIKDEFVVLKIRNRS